MAVPLEAWPRRGVDTGRGGARRCSRVLVVDRERERAEGIGTEGEIRESERVCGAAWRLQGVVEASREAGGGRGGIGARHRAASVRGEDDDTGEVVGWAGQLQCWAGLANR